jgi:hypothetical protein
MSRYSDHDPYIDAASGVHRQAGGLKGLAARDPLSVPTLFFILSRD